MGTITIEFDDNILAKALGAVMGGTSSGKGGSDDEEVTVEEIKALCKELGAKVCRPVLKDAGFASPAKISDDEDPEVLAELYDSLMDLKEDDDEDPEGEEVDVETVKKAVQAYAKENGKAEADEVLEEFSIKSVRSLNKLSEEDLKELYEAVTE